MNKSSLPTGLKDVLGALLEDHREAKKLFKDFEKAKSSEEKEEIARTVCEALTLHTQLEEEFFYPAVRELESDSIKALLDEAEVEHASAKELIQQIEGIGADDALFEAKVTVLGEYVSHHIREEEEELFPKLVEEKVDLREVGAAMEEKRNELVAH
ncbi:hemerythrin domain-containing protein [Azoarcus olearius]|uniref:Hemerythrin-like domain-containing protein n=1 Tax=Azoarcus sp. (strain BH72) TaxID=418699 RepID=A1K293_AZOSB|nr:hemerythrin domain-containing protein [Azoarcus olearius]ANQ83421.1 hypothetical protein dqs_0344 [Azoarcus olearius]CAL92948.1 conserved hypothetical protein [Azoarcus olearius]